MRRPSRFPAALLAVGALVVGACAELDDEELTAFLREPAEETALPPPTDLDDGTATGDVAGDFTGDRPGPDTDPHSDDPMATTASIDRGTAVRPEPRRVVCPFEARDLSPVRCGEVDLPGRGADDDYGVTIAFARFFATGEADTIAADPVVYLHGGPGGAILADAEYWYDSIVAPHIERRDVILYDQRGGGESTTLPRCHETLAVNDRFYEEPTAHADLRDEFLDAMAACAEKFTERTEVDLTAYDSLANAQDLNDLLWALDVNRYNLHGSSYGTRLAQTVMREYPQGVRSLVLSGAYPVEENLIGSIPVSLESSLEAVFAACADDRDCAAALPDPWTALENLVADLDADPLTVDVAQTLETTTTVRLDGTDLLNGLHQVLYVGEDAAEVPDLLIDHRDGDDDRLRRLARHSVFDVSHSAAFLLVQCADEAGFTSEADLGRPLRHEFLRAVDDVPALNGTDALALCAEWDTGPTDPVANEPVTWEAPTLLLAGAADPITPPAWAAGMAQRLPDARLVVLADRAHDSDEGWCGEELLATFVDDPGSEFDAACADTPLVPAGRAARFREPVRFSPLELRLDGRDGVVTMDVPNWWGDWRGDRHLRWRDLDEFDHTALVVSSMRDDYPVAEHLGFVGAALEWDSTPRAEGPPGWTREVAATAAGTVVRYGNDALDLRVTLVMEPEEREDLELSILLPAVASISAT